MPDEPLSNLQREILKLYSTNLSKDELRELKIVLAKYYSDKAIKEADKLWNEKNLSNSNMDTWLNE